MTEKLLTELYTKPKYGVAFSSSYNLWKKAKEYDNSITKSQVKEFLKNKLSYSLYLPTKPVILC